MSDHIPRALLLISRSRYDLAEKHVNLALAESPDDPMAHALNAAIISNKKKYKEAEKEAKHAIHLGPDIGYCHFILACVFVEQGYLDEAIEPLQEAIRLDPGNEEYFSVLSAIYLEKMHWEEALKAAEQGLQINPEHTKCLNRRAMALRMLGRGQEAAESITSTLANKPEDSDAHSNLGWYYLENGKTDKALESFKEALRIDPESEMAREGTISALKSKYLLYRIFLKYIFWAQKLSPRQRTGFLIGIYIVARFFKPLLFLYLPFIYFTWIADPLFNLLLRLNKFGRLVLSRDEIVASNWIGASILGFIISLVLSFTIEKGKFFWFCSGYFALLVFPLATTFRVTSSRRIKMAIWTACLAIIGIFSISTMIKTDKLSEVGAIAFAIFFFTCIMSSWFYREDLEIMSEKKHIKAAFNRPVLRVILWLTGLTLMGLGIMLALASIMLGIYFFETSSNDLFFPVLGLILALVLFYLGYKLR